MAQIAYLLQPKAKSVVLQTTLLKASSASEQNKNYDSIASLCRKGNESGNKKAKASGSK